MNRLQEGLVLGDRYSLTSRIASGGMGDVWEADDTVLSRSVAVKVLRPGTDEEEVFARRFRSEALYTANLCHPNIATVFDYGEDDNLAYLVMELVPGEPLSALVQREGALEPERVRAIMGQAALALGAAHEAGVVHRDVKPANILVMPDGTVKLTDFGIARAVDGSGHTQTGEVLGTPHYLSPEQALGEAATGASDLYALGVVGARAAHRQKAVRQGHAGGDRPGTGQRAAPAAAPARAAGLRSLIEQCLEKEAGEPAGIGARAGRAARRAGGRPARGDRGCRGRRRDRRRRRGVGRRPARGTAALDRRDGPDTHTDERAGRAQGARALGVGARVQRGPAGRRGDLVLPRPLRHAEARRPDGVRHRGQRPRPGVASKADGATRVRGPRMNVLVVGANGQLGAACCRALVAAGHAVRGRCAHPTRGRRTSRGSSWSRPTSRRTPTSTRCSRGTEAVVITANVAAPPRRRRPGPVQRGRAPAHRRRAGGSASSRIVLPSVPRTPTSTRRCRSRRRGRLLEQHVLAAVPGLGRAAVPAVHGGLAGPRGSSLPLRGEPFATIGRPSPFLRTSAGPPGRRSRPRPRCWSPARPATGRRSSRSTTSRRRAPWPSARTAWRVARSTSVGPRCSAGSRWPTIFSRVLGRHVRPLSTPTAVFAAAAAVLRPFAQVPSATMALNRYLGSSESVWTPGGGGLAGALGHDHRRAVPPPQGSTAGGAARRGVSRRPLTRTTGTTGGPVPPGDAR